MKFSTKNQLDKLDDLLQQELFMIRKWINYERLTCNMSRWLKLTVIIQKIEGMSFDVLFWGYMHKLKSFYFKEITKHENHFVCQFPNTHTANQMINETDESFHSATSSIERHKH